MLPIMNITFLSSDCSSLRSQNPRILVFNSYCTFREELPKNIEMKEKTVPRKIALQYEDEYESGEEDGEEGVMRRERSRERTKRKESSQKTQNNTRRE